ncbi:hypothetical protein NM688_g1739 [Phlebia brevispora]|uniref:Uncharacterized protein n=1 Tax=Phlebia brevispora TaxID=194682 RepID=A0ACC1TAY4_9APHY|nr:hypothetical protein NM688_g1739 [Phlebia brevispora]
MEGQHGSHDQRNLPWVGHANFNFNQDLWMIPEAVCYRLHLPSLYRNRGHHKIPTSISTNMRKTHRWQATPARTTAAADINP